MQLQVVYYLFLSFSWDTSIGSPAYLASLKLNSTGGLNALTARQLWLSFVQARCDANPSMDKKREAKGARNRYKTQKLFATR